MRIHGVDDVGFHALNFIRRERAFEYDDLGTSDEWALLAGENLQALCCGVGTLVKLAGEKFNGETRLIFRDGERR